MGISTVNMLAAHSMVTGSLLNKLVSETDDKWGKPWDAISKPMRVYAVADVKHGHVLWNTLVGCNIRDLFPDPEVALYLTGTDQREFVAEFNTLLVEALAGTEIQMGQLLSAQSRKDIAQCIHYRTLTGAVSSRPPSQVEVLTKLYSPWSNISYGGCDYLRQAQVETLRKYEVLHEYVASRDNNGSMFSRPLADEDRRYVLLGLPSGECHPSADLPAGGVPPHGWGEVPGHRVPAPRFGAWATIQDWTRFSWTHDRPMRACILEWILMDLSRAAGFIDLISVDFKFRSRFSGYYTSVVAVLRRLVAPEPETLTFIAGKLERLQDALKSEERWLESARREVTAREERVPYFTTTLQCAEDNDWDMVIGYESRILALPPRPPTCRARKIPRADRTSTLKRVSRKRKRSISRAPTGVKRPASRKTETKDDGVDDRRERSRRQSREWPRGNSVTRRRSKSRPPSAARVHRDDLEHRSLGRVSKQTAKKGKISDLLYDTVQVEQLLMRFKTGERSVEYALDASPVSDHSQQDIDSVLDDQALDLDAHHSQDDINVSVDEAS